VYFATNVYDFKSALIKRVIDIVGLLISIIFIAPAIKLESKGSVFFFQSDLERMAELLIYIQVAFYVY